MSVLIFFLLFQFFIKVTETVPDASTCIVLAILAAGEFIGWRCGK